MRKFALCMALIILALTAAGCAASSANGSDDTDTYVLALYGSADTTLDDVTIGTDDGTDAAAPSETTGETETDADEAGSGLTETEIDPTGTEEVASPETTAAPETTKSPETTKAPEITKAPETTKAAETTKSSETTKATGATSTSSHTHKWHDYDYDYGALGLDVEPGVRCEICNIWRCDVEGHKSSGTPTCIWGVSCLYCGKTLADSLGGHSYVDGECSRCGDLDFTSEVLLNRLGERIAYYINQLRVEQGSPATEILPIMTEVAMYRAVQLTTNYAHDNKDMREAWAHFQYGEHGDVWEAIGVNTGSKSIDALAYSIATQIKASAGHWSYVGDPNKKYIGVGIAREGGFCYFCIMVSELNHG